MVCGRRGAVREETHWRRRDSIGVGVGGGIRTRPVSTPSHTDDGDEDMVLMESHDATVLAHVAGYTGCDRM